MAKGDKPRGRTSAYAFFMQTCREEHKKMHPNENLVFVEFSKKCANRWKTMSEDEKQRFHQMANKDKKRFDTEMADYEPPQGDKSKKRKRTKDPNAPKRPLSAFFWFCNDERANVRQETPDASVGTVAKVLGRRWNDIEDDVKSKYEGLAAKDKARYEKELKAYNGKETKGKKTKGASATKKDEDEDEEEDSEEEEEEEDED